MVSVKAFFFHAWISFGLGALVYADIDECAANTHACSHNADCKNVDGSFQCTCKTGFSGNGKTCYATRGWYSHDPAQSCKDIRDFGSSKGDGDYWIAPGKSEKPLKVFCDMTTDGGGWLLVSNFVMHSSSPPSQLPEKTSYHGISSKQTLLTKSAMNELRSYMHFTQLRFNCKKKQGFTFHVTTAANSSGEAVVRYFSGQTDVQPASCGSFVIMNDDNSRLAQVCQKWGYHKVGKWGFRAGRDRLYNHPVFVEHAHHWIVGWNGRWECDDQHVRVSPGDFWKVFVR